VVYKQLFPVLEVLLVHVEVEEVMALTKKLKMNILQQEYIENFDHDLIQGYMEVCIDIPDYNDLHLDIVVLFEYHMQRSMHLNMA
jgi:hypothetical protein